ncbi:MAG: hypothetical protein PHR51_02095 [Patescibacteria group bacterium]|nr:hypothetical protein [Patescibacteria group bacterium]
MVGCSRIPIMAHQRGELWVKELISRSVPNVDKSIPQINLCAHEEGVISRG